MRSIRWTAWRLTTAGLLVSAASATGCRLTDLAGPNLNVNLIIPAGFGGNPGAFNPFGITQAIVNAVLGLGGSGDTSGADTGGSAAPSSAPTSGAIAVIQ
jgi:hypothetical protein